VLFAAAKLLVYYCLIVTVVLTKTDRTMVTVYLRFRDTGDVFFQGQGRSATSGGRKATLTGRFDFRHKVSYQCSTETICLECTPLPYVNGTDRQTNGHSLTERIHGIP